MEVYVVTDECITMSEIAEITGLSVGTLRNYRTDGSLPAPCGKRGKCWIWERAQIEEWNVVRPRIGQYGRGRPKMKTPE